MSALLTAESKRLLKDLLKTGKWENQSEIMRYALYLLKNEHELERQRDLPKPLPKGILKRIYENETLAERRLERKLAKASMRIKPEPFDE